jgi:hypothetical protein
LQRFARAEHNMAKIRPVAAVILCLGFTGSHLAWADPSQDVSSKWVENPYQKHNTTGAEVRFGSVVGILAVDGKEYTGLGALIAAGHRFGRIALDAEYAYLSVTERGPSDFRYGTAHQLQVNARLDVLQLDSTIVGPNSLVAIYIEGSAGRELRQAYALDPGDPLHKPMPGGGTNLLAAGFGIMIDHRLEQPLGFPNRVAWQLGWRIFGAPRNEPMTIATCKGAVCTESKMGPSSSMQFGVDETSLEVDSSLAFTW